MESVSHCSEWSFGPKVKIKLFLFKWVILVIYLQQRFVGDFLITVLKDSL